MKVNTVMVLISFLLSLLFAYLFTSYASEEGIALQGAGTFAGFFFSIVGTLGISFPYERTTTLTRTVSSLFLLPALVLNILFLKGILDPQTYVFIVSLAILLQVLLVYSISNSKH